MVDFDGLLTEATAPQPSAEEIEGKRRDDIQDLVHGVIGRHAEFFAQPENRLDFVQDLSAREFFRLSQYVNAKVRGEQPLALRKNPLERRGGSLPLLHTPKASDKLPAFSRGFDAIQEYLRTNDDTPEKQLVAVAAAAEALIIWVHPFNDGNGRTSRFISELIEDGANNVDKLVEETASSTVRPIYYAPKFASKEGRLATANDDDLMLDEDEREAIRVGAEKLPDDIEAVYLSVKHVLSDETLRENMREQAESRRLKITIR